LAPQLRLTNLAAFHCQQCIEKCFKAVMEERDIQFIKSHDLLRLKALVKIPLDDPDLHTLRVINEVYIDSRYPGDLGLLPLGKPTSKEILSFIGLAEKIFYQTKIFIEA
jgi:HEPN domain-containing protein